MVAAPIIVDYTGVEKTHSPRIATPRKYIYLERSGIILNCINHKVTIRLSKIEANNILVIILKVIEQ